MLSEILWPYERCRVVRERLGPSPGLVALATACRIGILMAHDAPKVRSSLSGRTKAAVPLGNQRVGVSPQSDIGTGDEHRRWLRHAVHSSLVYAPWGVVILARFPTPLRHQATGGTLRETLSQSSQVPKLLPPTPPQPPQRVFQHSDIGSRPNAWG